MEVKETKVLAPHTGVLKKSRKTYYSLFTVSLILLAGVGLYAWKSGYLPGGKTEQKAQTVRQECNKDSTSDYCALLKEATGLLDPGKVKELSVVAEKIRKTEGYDKDPNYLYVVLTYHINLSDSENARKTYNLLKDAYGSEIGYDPLLVDTKTPDELEPVVSFLEKNREAVDKNSFTVPPEPQ